MADQEKKGEVVAFRATAKHRVRKPFVSHNGNPENGDYGEFARSQCADSSVVALPSEKPVKK